MSSIDHGKLPSNYGNNALKFSDEDIEELPAFLENIETICQKVGATSPADKKWVALHYCVAKTKEQWKALATAEDPHSWEAFVAEVKANYPELKELERGSLKAMRKFAEKTSKRPIKVDELVTLQGYNREFRAMMKKLLEGTPKIVNREAVAFYLKGLHPDLVMQVKLYLRMQPRATLGSSLRAQRLWEAANQGKVYVPPPVDEDDPYDWTDLVDVATKVCEEENSSVFGSEIVTLVDTRRKASTVLLQGGIAEDSVPAPLKTLADKVSKLEADSTSAVKDAAKQRDAFAKEMRDHISSSIASSMDKFTADNKREIQQIKAVLEGARSDSSIQQSSTKRAGPSFVDSRTRGVYMKCFYCFENGHFILDCPEHKEDVIKGIVRHENSQTKFFDGKNIPREPKDKSPMMKAHEYYARRTVGQNYDAVMDQFFGKEESEDGDSEDTGNDGELAQILAAINTMVTRSKGSSGAKKDF